MESLNFYFEMFGYKSRISNLKFELGGDSSGIFRMNLSNVIREGYLVQLKCMPLRGES